jgi:hypothetical protein
MSYILPEKRPWELIFGSEEIKILTVNEDKTDFQITNLWQWQCNHCGDTLETPDPAPPIFCPKCDKRMFRPLFPEELKILYDKRWRIPWQISSNPEKCELNDLYDGLKNCMKKHVVLTRDELYDIATCWILTSWKAEYIPSCAYILLRGEHESGKSRFLEMLARLAYRGIITVSVSPPLLFRQIDNFGCTCLIDQAEDQLDRKYEEGAQKYAIVASGYKKDAFVGRIGKDNVDKIQYFDTFSLKALASTKSFDMALDSRCIIIDMEEATPEKEDIDEQECKDLRSKLLYWRLCDIPFKIVPTVLKRRLRELFLPLLWIAEMRGTKTLIENFGNQYQIARRKELPDEFRASLIDMITDLSTEAWNKEEDESGRLYLNEIKDAFTEKGWENMSTQRIGLTLKDMDVPRASKVKGKGRYLDFSDDATARKINYYLKKFGLVGELKSVELQKTL